MSLLVHRHALVVWSWLETMGDIGNAIMLLSLAPAGPSRVSTAGALAGSLASCLWLKEYCDNQHALHPTNLKTMSIAAWSRAYKDTH